MPFGLQLSRKVKKRESEVDCDLIVIEDGQDRIEIRLMRIRGSNSASIGVLAPKRFNIHRGDKMEEGKEADHATD